MRKLILILAISTIVLAGCGRKGPPQPLADAPAPEIAMLKQSIEGNALHATIRITGGSHGVGYQVDRSEVDPFCKCPSFWRRYFEEPPSKKNFNKDLSRLFRLKQETEYVFRFRAIDALGRFTGWSTPFRAKSDKVFE